MISWTTELRDKYRNAVNAGYTAVVISPEGILSLLDALESAEVQADELRIMNGNLRALADEKIDAAGRATAKLCHMTDRADRLADQLSVLRRKKPVAVCTVEDGQMGADGFGECPHELEDGTYELFTRPVPPAANNLVSAGWQACRDGHWFSIKAEHVPHYRDNEEVPVREVYATSPHPPCFNQAHPCVSNPKKLPRTNEICRD